MLYKQYKLDRFQEEAIQSIDQNNSVIVAAPTGAGKTLIAEYAVEKHIKAGEQIIYTAPIKALSNQKYRDFSRDYGDKIGLITGDVVLNPEAPVLIMTTEIFRNTIFDDTSRLDDLRYVIFDEIHFIDDIERGTVWEESIIFAPQHINFICLSATIPNLREFAAWMRSVRHNKIDVVSETERPVPLEHKLYVKGHGLGWLDELKEMKNNLFSGEGTGKAQEARNGRRGFAQTQTLETLATGVEELVGIDLVEHIQFNDQLPCLYFSLSRKGCEGKALENIDRDFLMPEEKKAILRDYDKLCQKYSIHEDESAQTLKELITHGVAYHHAGMLPTLKEVVEQLFTKGYIKLLFTTETFALGINMPACSVVFDTVSKYDGVRFRYLKSREYHQMAGRAGRRGIDPKGFVYACVDLEYDEYDEIERIVTGEIERIESQFNLSYSSVLNLYEKHGDRIYDICNRSLNNYQSVRTVKRLERSLDNLSKQRSGLEELACISDGDTKKLWEYKTLDQELKLEKENLSLREKLRKNKHGRKKQNKIAGKIARLTKMMKSIKCYRCPNLGNCIRIANKMQQYNEQITGITQQKKLVESYQRQQIKSRLRLLREMGYIDDKGLLPRGQIAAQIFGYELQITELFFDGYFHRLDQDWINVLVMAIVFESKKDVWYRKLDKKDIKSLFTEPSRKIGKISDREEALQIDSPTRGLDIMLSVATYEWSKGCSFEELSEYTDSPPGDLVRYFRLASDLLRQMKRIISQDDVLYGKIADCITRINRDVVDAERQLRAV